MSSPLYLMNPGSKKRPITVPEFLGLLGSDHLDRTEQQVRVMREAFNCPAIVRDYKEFHDYLFAYYLHYLNWYYHVDSKEVPSRDLAFEFLRRHYKQDFHLVERNVIMGRDGGLIGVIDDITDALVKTHIESYIDLTFLDYLPHDYELRLRLAQELLNKYGTVLFPNEELVPPFILAANIQAVLKGFAMNLHAIRREWRY